MFTENFNQDYTNTALSADGIANDVAYSGGGYALTDDGADDDLGHLITILGNAATNHSAKTFTITGTDANDKSLTEGIAGPNGNVTVTSTKYFKTVTSVTVDSTTAGDTFDIGWTAGAVSPWVFTTQYKYENFLIGFGCAVISGSPTYSVQHSFDGGMQAFTHNAVSAETTSQTDSYAFPVLAVRMAFTVAGRVKMFGMVA